MNEEELEAINNHRKVCDSIEVTYHHEYEISNPGKPYFTVFNCAKCNKTFRALHKQEKSSGTEI